MDADASDATGRDLLDAADDLMAAAVPGTRALWPRTAAFLIRLALEQTLDELWATVQPRLADCSMRAQLLCLRTYAGEAAGRASAAWWGLSRACHYHTYELAPTGTELRHWYEEVVQVRHAIDRAAEEGREGALKHC